MNSLGQFPARNWKKDVNTARRAAAAVGLSVVAAVHNAKAVVLEGGAIDVNGAGTLLTTEECLLHPRIQVRNPGMSRVDYEQVFARSLGATRTIWLRNGIAGDDTHGHVDDLARFIDRKTIVLCRETNRRDANYRPLNENREILQGARLKNGSKPEVVMKYAKDVQILSTVAAKSGVPVVLMHNQEHTRYDDLVPDVISELRSIADNAMSSGVKPENVILDPGMGFGKTAEHNLEILRRLDEFAVLESPLLIGMSRKSTIGYVLDLPVEDRVEGTAATVALSIAGGADIVRVHDVKQMIRVARMSDAIVRGWERR